MVLIAAATPWEAGPVAKALGLAKDGSGRVGGREARLVVTGVGADRSSEALARVEAAGWPKADIVLSVGFSGALQEGLEPAELVADLRAAPLEWVQAARDTAAELAVPLHLGAFHSAARVLGPEEKRAAGRERRAIAVDMESAAVRAWSERRGATFAGLRAVFDAVGERAPTSGPEDASVASILRFLAAHATEAPRLLMLWPRQARGMRRLGRFLAHWLKRI